VWSAGDKLSLPSLLLPSVRGQRESLVPGVERKRARCRHGACGGGLVFKAHRLLHHSTLGLSVIKKKEEEALAVETGPGVGGGGEVSYDPGTPVEKALVVETGPGVEGSYLRLIDFCITQL